MSEVLRLVDVSFIRGERTILAPLTWKVAAGQRWLVLGANGSGKTTLLRIAAMYEHPSTGDVRVLGERLGHTDVRVLRRRIGYMSPSLAAQLRPELRCLDIVMTAKYAALEPWWHRYTEADEARALACLEQMGVAALAERSMATTSSGEQQRVLLARTLMNEPAVLLLDEPSARLDLGGREQLVQALAELTTDPSRASVDPGDSSPRRGSTGDDPRVDVPRRQRRGNRPDRPSADLGQPQRLLRHAPHSRTPRRRPVQRLVATSCSSRSRPDVIWSASTRSSAPPVHNEPP